MKDYKMVYLHQVNELIDERIDYYWRKLEAKDLSAEQEARILYTLNELNSMKRIIQNRDWS